jgi:hypothetical protein
MDRRDFLMGASLAMLGAAAKTKLWLKRRRMCGLKLRP